MKHFDTKTFVTTVLATVVATGVLALTGWLDDVLRIAWDAAGASIGFEWRTWHVATIVGLLFLAALIGYSTELDSPATTPTTRSTRPITPFVTSDNVRWEDWGDYINGGMVVGGPLCPKDLTPLRVPTTGGGSREVANSDYIGRGHGFLKCLTCGQDYLFDSVKRVETARDEAEVLLTGMRYRRQQGVVIES